jgi:hypothetical protein
MSPFDALFAGESLARFLAEDFGRRPSARPDVARAAVPLLGWTEVGSILAQSPDALVTDRGRVLDVPVPRSLEALRRGFARGWSMVIRHVERHDARLAALSDEFARRLDGTSHVQVFVTPRGRRGFGWHYDLEEVLVLQTVGRKQYWFRENTVVPRERLPSVDFAAVARESSPLMTTTLIAGDFLHLPSGTWHVARAEEDALHLSIGITPRRAGASCLVAR